MGTVIEKRTHPRIDCQLIVRIYTSVVSGPYSVKTKNVSQGGAFFQTKLLPKKGETISYELVDQQSWEILYQGLGKVARVDDSFFESGFSVTFYDRLEQNFLAELVTAA